MSLFIHEDVAIYFDSFGIEYISQESLKKIKDESITHNAFKIQENEAYRKNFVKLY